MKKFLTQIFNNKSEDFSHIKVIKTDK